MHVDFLCKLVIRKFLPLQSIQSTYSMLMILILPHASPFPTWGHIHDTLAADALIVGRSTEAETSLLPFLTKGIPPRKPL